MNITYFNRILGVFAAVVALLISANAFAASDYLLEIEGIKGECKGKHIKLTENADGSFTAENIPGGTYKLIYTRVEPGVQVAPSQTKVIVMAFEGVISPHDPATGQSSGKRSSVQAPRDVATGQSSGKRQHKPFTITKEWNASTPKLFLGQIVVGDDDGDGSSDRGKVTSTNPPENKGKVGYDLKLNKKV